MDKDLPSKSIESPRPNGKPRTTTESRINRPFKSPFSGGKGSTTSKAESSPCSTTPLCLRNDEQNKRMRSPIQSPLSSRIVKNGTVTPLQFNRLKRARLSTPSLEDLRQKETQLDREIAELVSENLSLEELDHQIDLLHRYNDIKDVAQIVMGRLAELENVTVKSLHGNVVDLILVVEDAETFHRLNLERNSKHYSSMKYLGPHLLASFQEKWGARVYFNTLVPYKHGLLKYGVISSSSLVADLLDWEWMYISGRLHKPVMPLVLPHSSHPLRSAIKHNLQNAMHTALLLLPDTFQEETLYQTLAGLSYSGDFRMIFGEDRNKVKNIVTPQIEKFRELYSPVWPGLASYAEFNTSSGKCEQDTSPSARMFHLNLLPKQIQQTIVHEWNRNGRWQDVEDVFRAAAHDTECPELVKEAVQKTVKTSSWSQSLKGIPTAGFFKAVRYGFAKIKKFSKSLKKTHQDSE